MFQSTRPRGARHEIDVNTAAGKMKAGGEYIAWLAEKGQTEVPLMQKIISAIRNILREMGFDVELTDKDIISALSGIAKKMEKGRLVTAEETLDENPIDALYDIAKNRKEGPYDILKKFKNRYMLDIKDDDLKKFQSFYANPWHLGRKYEEFRGLLNIEMKREEARDEIISHLLANTVKTSESKIHEFMNLSDQESTKIFKVMVWCDANNEFLTNEADLKAKARELGVGELNAKQVRIKQMQTGWEQEIPLSGLLNFFLNK